MDDSQFLAAFREFPESVREIRWDEGGARFSLSRTLLHRDQGLVWARDLCHEGKVARKVPMTDHEAACIVERALRDVTYVQQIFVQGERYPDRWVVYGPFGYLWDTGDMGSWDGRNWWKSERAALIAATKAVLKEEKE